MTDVQIHEKDQKTALVAGDSIPVSDSADSNKTKRVTTTNLFKDIPVALTVNNTLKVDESGGGDYVSLSHDGTNAYIKTDDGDVIVLTDEGTNTNTTLSVKGKGTGRGQVFVYDGDNAEYVALYASAGDGLIDVFGTAAGDLKLMASASGNLLVFSGAEEGETPSYQQSGFRTGDSKRTFQVVVGGTAADQVDFSGLSTYSFAGDVDIAASNKFSWTSDLYIQGATNDMKFYASGNKMLQIDGGDGTIYAYYDLSISDGKNIALNTSTGTKIGTATDQKIGFFNAAPVVQITEITDELTTITHTAPGTPDYALQNLTNSSPYGFVTQDEGNTLISVVVNTVARVNEIEAGLAALGLFADAD